MARAQAMVQERALAEAQQAQSAGQAAAGAAQPVRPLDEARAQTAVGSVAHEASDETNELSSVRPSRALDAVDMTSSPDLISFSLGAPRNGIELKSQTPESLEIKSTKQVAKAVPVEQDAQPQADAQSGAQSGAQVDSSADAAASDAVPANQPSQAETAEDQSAQQPESVAQTAPLSDTAAFHAAEINRDVDAPEATAESLSVGLEAILSRRSA
ncbi:membrane protein [Bifidobacterium biavatii DSM 23969]|uniref:Membrane protein n=3 Tax=Bifidobacterium biavatii TaxID=762212 RepID=A0A086ZRG7_9BIFI|nr:membrane protein [Bifidobacterium biavatii DSM 23969]